MKKLVQPVVCSAAKPRCSTANYGIGCYHRDPHEHTNNCRCCADRHGYHWCSRVKQDARCRPVEKPKENT